MKTVIITGASGGLGQAVTKEFLDKNYRVLATVSGEKSKTQLSAHPNLSVFVVDLSDEEQSAAFAQQCIRDHQHIDAALLLAGGFAPGQIAQTTAKDIHQQIAMNFETAYNMVRPLFVHFMENKKGHIVLIGARPAIVASQGKNSLAYSLSKSLLFRLAEILNAESAKTGVKTSVIVPSTLDTPANRQAMPDQDPEKWVKPAALAQSLSFLVSDTSDSWRDSVIKIYNQV